MHPLPSPLFLLLPLGLMVLVPFVLRYVTGWTTLARPFAGPSTAFPSATLNWFTLAFPPLLIPWADISATPKQGIFVPVVAFRFAQAPQVSWSVTAGLGQELLAARLGAN